MNKKIVAVILAIISAISCFSATTVFGQTVEEEYEIQPRFTYISTVAPSFTIKGFKVYASGSMTSKTSTNLSIQLQLQKKSGDSYVPEITWTANKTGTSLSLNKEKTINPLSSWRLMAVFEAGSERTTKFLYD